MRPLLLASLLAAALPAAAQTRLSVREYLAAEVRTDDGFSEGDKSRLLEALDARFAAYANDVANAQRQEGLKVVMRMLIEGQFDQASPERMAEVGFAAYQAISRGAPADVVEGIALYGYRKSIPGDRISVWANGYRQMTDAKVPDDVAADLVRLAMERDLGDDVFNTLKWALVQGARDGFDLRDYASYLFGHLLAGRKPGELTGEARAVFRKAAKAKAKPELPAYEGGFRRAPFKEVVYEAKPAAQEPPSPKAKSVGRSPEVAKVQTPRELGLAMARLWPALEASARAYLGTPYVWGGTSRKGIDCSGFTQNSYAENRVRIPRVSYEQYKVGEEIEYGDLREGDLVFFNTKGTGISHVGMLVGPRPRRFMHASSSRGVVIDDLDKQYYKARYRGAKRIIP